MTALLSALTFITMMGLFYLAFVSRYGLLERHIRREEAGRGSRSPAVRRNAHLRVDGRGGGRVRLLPRAWRTTAH